MAIVFDAASGVGATISGGTVTKAHTVTAAGSGRIILVGVYVYIGSDTSGDITGVTYAGDTLTKLYENRRGNYKIYLWYLVAPATGANNVVLTGVSCSSVGVAIASYTGVDPVNPLGTHLGSHVNCTASTTDTEANVTLTSEADEMCVAFGGAVHGDTSRDIFPSAGLADRGQWRRTDGSPYTYGMWADVAGEASRYMGVGINHNTTSSYIGIIAVPLKPEMVGIARSIKYNSNTLDPKNRVFDNYGRVVPASLVEYNNWMRNEGPYFMTPKKHTSLIEADPIGYLEAIKFNERGRTQYITETETLLESLFRRLGARGA